MLDGRCSGSDRTAGHYWCCPSWLQTPIAIERLRRRFAGSKVSGARAILAFERRFAGSQVVGLLSLSCPQLAYRLWGNRSGQVLDSTSQAGLREGWDALKQSPKVCAYCRAGLCWLFLAEWRSMELNLEREPLLASECKGQKGPPVAQAHTVRSIHVQTPDCKSAKQG